LRSVVVGQELEHAAGGSIVRTALAACRNADNLSIKRYAASICGNRQ
jgi:hypothetical protein